MSAAPRPRGVQMGAAPAGKRAAERRGPITRSGLLPWVFPAMLLVAAVDVLLSGRDLATSFQALEMVSAPARPAVVDWLQRAVSLLLLAASLEQAMQTLRRNQAIAKVFSQAGVSYHAPGG